MPQYSPNGGFSTLKGCSSIPKAIELPLLLNKESEVSTRGEQNPIIRVACLTKHNETHQQVPIGIPNIQSTSYHIRLVSWPETDKINKSW